MTLSRLSKYNAFAPVVLRIVAGIIFFLAGWGKLFGPVPGIEGFTGMLAGLGFPAAGALAVLVGLVELLGGLMLILGVYTRYAALPLGIIMIVSLFTAKFGQWTTAGRVDWTLLAIMVSLMLSGAGAAALDRMWRK